MREVLLLDTGPLVALLNRLDSFHAWAVAEFENCQPPLVTCEAVLSEACYLMRGLAGGREAVLELVRRGMIAAPFRLEEEAEAVAALVARYSNVPMALADACLVRLAEQYSSSTVFTLDSDFTIYRKHGRRVIPCRRPHLTPERKMAGEGEARRPRGEKKIEQRKRW